MKILYITNSGEDYLQDQMLIGLRGLYGADVVDAPRKDVVYENCPIPNSELYGCGFTVCKNLPDIEVDRENIVERLKAGEFDLVVFSSIRRQRRLYREWRWKGYLTSRYAKFCFLNGEDRRRIHMPTAVLFGRYFKREQWAWLKLPWFEKINFTIPDRKIREEPLEKTKLFAKHVQCDEAYKIKEIKENCTAKYAFDNESDYYDDIARSHYAVTMKKGGWECMRHYEISANHTVPAFYRLNEKPDHCAPHGLVDMENVVVFNTAEELQAKIDRIESEGRYPQLQANAHAWAVKNSCKNYAADLLKRLGF